MKNKEKYAKEIMDIACSGDSIAVIKKSGRIAPCDGTYCAACLFRDVDCKEKVREWAESEYIEKPVISKRDRAFLEYLDTIIHYVTRDLNDDLYIYISKPHKLIDCWESEREADKILRMFNIDLPMVKWSNEEPWLIEDLKKLEVVEEYEKH